MYTLESNELVKEWGSWLGSMSWDYFVTITYKFDVTMKQNQRLMNDLSNYLHSSGEGICVFWVTESAYGKAHTHNHMLVMGPNIYRLIFNFFNKRKLISDKFVRFLKYRKNLGANFYVAKYLGSAYTDYGLINTTLK